MPTPWLAEARKVNADTTASNNIWWRAKTIKFLIKHLKSLLLPCYFLSLWPKTSCFKHFFPKMSSSYLSKCRQSKHKSYLQVFWDCHVFLFDGPQVMGQLLRDFCHTLFFILIIAVISTVRIAVHRTCLPPCRRTCTTHIVQTSTPWHLQLWNAKMVTHLDRRNIPWHNCVSHNHSSSIISTLQTLVIPIFKERNVPVLWSEKQGIGILVSASVHMANTSIIKENKEYVIK